MSNVDKASKIDVEYQLYFSSGMHALTVMLLDLIIFEKKKKNAKT